MTVEIAGNTGDPLGTDRDRKGNSRYTRVLGPLLGQLLGSVFYFADTRRSRKPTFQRLWPHCFCRGLILSSISAVVYLSSPLRWEWKRVKKEFCYSKCSSFFFLLYVCAHVGKMKKVLGNCMECTAAEIAIFNKYWILDGKICLGKTEKGVSRKQASEFLRIESGLKMLHKILDVQTNTKKFWHELTSDWKFQNGCVDWNIIGEQLKLLQP